MSLLLVVTVLQFLKEHLSQWYLQTKNHLLSFSSKDWRRDRLMRLKHIQVNFCKVLQPISLVSLFNMKHTVLVLLWYVYTHLSAVLSRLLSLGCLNLFSIHLFAHFLCTVQYKDFVSLHNLSCANYDIELQHTCIWRFEKTSCSTWQIGIVAH